MRLSEAVADPLLVDPEGWEYDLQSVYSAYMGHFQLHSVRWDDCAWGQFFETFERFLAFCWPVIAATDTRTGRAHIVTRMSSVTAFLNMIQTRFGETLPRVDNMLTIQPVETAQQPLSHVSDGPSYRKLYSTLPTVTLTALKARIRGGDPSAIRALWAARDKTFLAIDFEFLERQGRPCVEWGYAAIRSSHLEAAGAWPPVPDTNYRKGHYIVSEYAQKFDKASPSVSWQYAFGESQVIPRTNLPRIIQSVLSGLVSPDSDSIANAVVLVGHGVRLVVQHLEEMKIDLPENMLVLDIAYLERALFTSGERGQMCDRKTGNARRPESLLSFNSLLHSLGVELPCVLHNSGNDAVLTLVALQKMADPRGAAAVVPKGVGVVGKAGRDASTTHGHVKRAATVAARIFRPLGGVHPDLGTQRNENVPLGSQHGQGIAPHVRAARRAKGADEMGMRRTSMLSVLTSPSLATDKNKKAGTAANLKGNRMSVELKSGWSSPSTIGPDRKRQSTVEKRR